MSLKCIISIKKISELFCILEQNPGFKSVRISKAWLATRAMSSIRKLSFKVFISSVFCSPLILMLTLVCCLQVYHWGVHSGFLPNLNCGSGIGPYCWRGTFSELVLYCLTFWLSGSKTSDWNLVAFLSFPKYLAFHEDLRFLDYADSHWWADQSFPYPLRFLSVSWRWLTVTVCSAAVFSRPSLKGSWSWCRGGIVTMLSH